MSQRGCGFFRNREGPSPICPLAKDANKSASVAFPGSCSIVSHPPKIAAGWGSLGRDGAWASPQNSLS
jgi:hypothetical protein